MTILRGTRQHIVLLTAVILISIIAIGPATLISRSVSNAGLLALSRSMVQNGVIDRAERVDPDLVNAERWLRTASDLSVMNQGAWRGLGFALAAQGHEAEAMTAWRTAGKMWNEFMQWGDIALNREQANQALQWYQRATTLEPDIGDGWYFQGLAYEALGRWEDGLHAYKSAVAASTFVKTGQSSLYYRIGIILQWHTTHPQLQGALNAFESAIVLNAFSIKEEAADAHYRIGSIYKLQGLDPNDSLPEYQQALQLDPRHYWAHLELGYTLYRLHKNVNEAEREINLALDLWPDAINLKWPYRYLGEIYLEAGLRDQAATTFTEVLRIDPADNRALEVLRTLSGD